MLDKFQTASASVPGSEHIRRFINNQDAYFIDHFENYSLATVFDGCGSGKYSEVGANLGKLWMRAAFSELLPHFYNSETSSFELSSPFWKVVKDKLVSNIRQSIVLSCSSGRLQDQLEVLKDFFLFTFLGVFITPKLTYIFSIGDGVYILNGEITEIKPTEGNRPPYVAYNLTDTNIDSSLLEITVQRVVSTDEVESLVIGTDGLMDFILCENEELASCDRVGHISQLWKNDTFYSNLAALQNKLKLMNKTQSRLTKVESEIVPDMKLISEWLLSAELKDNVREMLEEMIRKNKVVPKLKQFRPLLPDDTTIIAFRKFMQEEIRDDEDIREEFSSPLG